MLDKEAKEVVDDVVMANHFYNDLDLDNNSSPKDFDLISMMKNKKINEYIELLKCRR